MAKIIIVFPKEEDAQSIKKLLVKNGFDVAGVCTSGTQALSYADNLDDGLVISGYQCADMIYSQLHADLPKYFEMLLVASKRVWSECVGNDIMCISMPVKVYEFISTVKMMTDNIDRMHRKRKKLPKERKPEEQKLIQEAKELLMDRNNMTEEEAHRYLQRCSMESGNSLVETAQMVFTIMA